MNYRITGFCVLYSDYPPYDLALYTFIWLGMIRFRTSNSNMATHTFVWLSKIQVGTSNSYFTTQAFIWLSMVDCAWNVMAHAQKPDFIFQRDRLVSSVDYWQPRCAHQQ